jgi:hypothetical protein
MIKQSNEREWSVARMLREIYNVLLGKSERRIPVGRPTW